MCSSQYVSQPSMDLGIYLPSGMTFGDATDFPSVDDLMASAGCEFLASSHRCEMNLFDPQADDEEAISSLIDVSSPHESVYDSQTREILSYFCDVSTAVPHISEGPLQIPAQQNYPISHKKFSIFNPATGRERPPLLHEFIRQLLDFDEYSHLIEYVDRKHGIFRLREPKILSELWKQVKGRNSEKS